MFQGCNDPTLWDEVRQQRQNEMESESMQGIVRIGVRLRV